MSEQPLWNPSKDRVEATNLYRFMQRINRNYGLQLTEYEELRVWALEHISDFWKEMWDDARIIASSPYTQVVDDPHKMPGAKWFNGARLNFAENLLRYRDDKPAVVFRGEAMSQSRSVSYAELYDQVARLADSLRKSGVVAGDRVVGFMPNMPETIVAMLAAASIGAAWSSCSPDFGTKGVLDRFGQIEPKVLFTANGYSYGGKQFSSIDKVAEIVPQLSSKPLVVVVPYTEERADISSIPGAVHYRDYTSSEEDLEIDFEQVPFDHPLYIMYSSGTTGLPKCMVQSVGGILIHHIKELALHTDLKRDDNIFYFTTCGWMMWNWLVSSLSLGATVVLFDGSPFYPDAGALLRLAQEEHVSIFGTSAKYIAAIEEAGVRGDDYDLSAMQSILSTGSPLIPSSFEYVYRDLKSDICLASIAGGTDLNGCFAGGNPMGPVYKNELQARCLAMDVHALGDDGGSVTEERGELVCKAAFPSMPIYFWNDPDGQKYHKAYFDVYPGIWRHGDFIIVTDHGGVIMLGRSDATLNPGGVRIGTSEIYRVLQNMDELDDSLVVGQDWENDVRVILFVQLAKGLSLNDVLVKRIKSSIRSGCSPRHVPAKVIAVADIPYTINMKKVELAVKNIIHGKEVTNRDALRNPESLELYRDLAELKD